MKSKTAQLLLTKIVPIITATVPRTVRPTGCEDVEEIVQDTIATAAEMLDSVEKAGKKPLPKSIAFYSIQRAKTGRRAYQHSANDVLGPMFRTENEGAVACIDAPLSEDAGHLTMHDELADRRESPDQEALRRIDWEEFSNSLDRREKRILDDAASGRQGRETAEALGISAGRVAQIRRGLGRKLRSHMGEGILADISTSPQWRRDLVAVHERNAYRYAAAGDDGFEPEAA